MKTCCSTVCSVGTGGVTFEGQPEQYVPQREPVQSPSSALCLAHHLIVDSPEEAQMAGAKKVGILFNVGMCGPDRVSLAFLMSKEPFALWQRINQNGRSSSRVRTRQLGQDKPALRCRCLAAFDATAINLT